MAVTTDFIGQVGIEPALSDDQMHYLAILREVGPFKGRPPFTSGWVASDDGRSLTVRGDDKYGDPAEWLRHLIKCYIKPSGLRADGMVVGCRRDTMELFSIHVAANRVTVRGLWPRSAQPREAQSREARPREAPRRATPPPRPTAKVIDLAARRARA